MEELAKRVLTTKDYEVAKYTVEFVKKLPGIRSIEIQRLMERIAWLTNTELETLNEEALGLSGTEYLDVFMGIRITQRPEWYPIG